MHLIRTLASRAFVFDIDGVLLRGGRALPGARATLQHLRDTRVPFALLTNGGGMLESARALRLSDTLGVEIHENQLVQSHTPFKALVADYAKVLAIGGRHGSVRDLALAYGFRDVVTPLDLVGANPAAWPFHEYGSELRQARPVSKAPVDAVLVFHDPTDFGASLQAVCDAATALPVPVYFSNLDLLWANEYPRSRLGQGAFRIAVEGCYAAMTGAKLPSVLMGKPYTVAYDYAAKVIAEQARALGYDSLGSVYMVGDNPALDIAGGNAYGWETVLLRLGVYQDGDGGAVPTMGVFDGVEEAVRALE